jgi:hypothetical protein
MTEERKFAILFAATLLCARKLAELDSDKPSPAKVYAVNTAIERAKFILDRIDEKWPTRRGTCRKLEWRRAECPSKSAVPASYRKF